MDPQKYHIAPLYLSDYLLQCHTLVAPPSSRVILLYNGGYRVREECGAKANWHSHTILLGIHYTINSIKATNVAFSTIYKFHISAF